MCAQGHAQKHNYFLVVSCDWRVKKIVSGPDGIHQPVVDQYARTSIKYISPVHGKKQYMVEVNLRIKQMVANKRDFMGYNMVH